MEVIDTDVLVVGGGPVGLSLAGDLGWRGVDCVLLEKTDGAIVQPKMDGVNVRTMEFCRRWGLTGEVRNCGYPKEFPQDMVYLTSFNGYELGREEFSTPSGGSEESRLGASPETRFRCPQNLFDPILRRFATRQASVTARYECRLVGFTQSSDGVTSVAKPLEGPELEIRSRYLVGCDGGASVVRKQAGIAMSGLGVLTHSTNVLFRCRELRENSSVRLGYRHLFIGPEGTWATVVAIDGRDNWRLSLIGTRQNVEHSEADLRRAIGRVIGKPADFEVLSVEPWTRRELNADAYRKGRVFIAGDSAHMTSPTGGFGMNLGIADAVDLAWKLEAALRGWGGPGLLDTYDIERRPVAQRALRESSGNLRRTLSPGPNPRLLDETWEGALCRYETGKLFSATMLREWYKLGIDLGYVYDSPIVVPQEEDFDGAAMRQGARPERVPPEGYLADGTRITASLLREWQRLSVHLALGSGTRIEWEQEPARAVMLYRQTARPGARAPHAWLPDGASTLDWYGRGFVLVDTSGDEASCGAMAGAAARRGVPLATRRVSDPEVATLQAAPLTLVRPDGHVAWRGRRLGGDDADALIDRVRGASAS